MMSHRSIFKPMKDRPSLDEVMEPVRSRDVREAYYRAFTADAALRLRDGMVREPGSLNRGQ